MALKLVEEWDKVFPKSDKIEHKKVTFKKPFRHRVGGRYVCSERREW